MLFNVVIPAQEQESQISNLLASEGFDHRAVWENVLFSPCETIHRDPDIFFALPKPGLKVKTSKNVLQHNYR